MQDVSTRADKVSEVETLLSAARAREQELEVRLEGIAHELHVLRGREKADLETREKVLEQKRVKKEEKEAHVEQKTLLQVAGESPSIRSIDVVSEDVEGRTRGAAEIAALQAEVNGLYSTIRHLRASEARLLYNSSTADPTPATADSIPGSLTRDALSWLREPLVLQKSTVLEDKARRRKQTANVLFDDFLTIVTSSAPLRLKDSFGPPLIKPDLQRKQNDVEHKYAGKQIETLRDQEAIVSRLTWRPAKQKTAWLVARQREEWEMWKGRAERFVNGGGNGRDDVLQTT